ncbi:MAG: DNA helicase RecQ [Flavobacteriales bacterium]|nr:DNA helicase RecQ [Flavobacteriales bacterium]
MSISSATLHKHLKDIFGFNSFKGRQEQIIQNLLDGKDGMVIMPTGGGKSMCYQLPSLISDGLAIIISPLIALMKNQVDAIRTFSEQKSIAHVLNSSLSKTQINIVMEDIKLGHTKMLYVAPESLIKEEYVSFLKSINISFFAIDEAHCISEWGHDFRPEYRRIREMIDNIGRKPIIALTATATPKVRHDIQKNLKILDSTLFVDSFNRKNLFYDIRPKHNVEKEIIKFIREHSGKSGVIYCLSRKKVEEIAETLQVNGINALPYHAGLDAKTRILNQDAFIMDDCDVIVATIAFGMGIDKPDIRFVIHHDIPKSLEGYYQETGRAGRDDGEGILVTFYSYKDIEKLEKFLSGKPVSEQEIGRQLIMETISFAETAMCRRKYLLHYFGEEFESEDCNTMCDNCRNPKPTFEGKEFVSKLLKAIEVSNETFKAKELAKIMIGERNSLINQHLSTITEIFGSGKDKGIEFWHAVIRQTYVKEIITKEIETYGTIKLTDQGREFLKKPYSFMLTEDHDYEKTSSSPISQKGGVMDDVLFNMLKQLRKKIAKKQSLPPAIIFQESSLIDMANNYPITMEEMSQIQGVGIGKAKKFGSEFMILIEKYVKENNIERPLDMMIKTIVNKSSNKVYIIQSLDKKLSIEDIARAKGLTSEELIKEIETIVESGTKLDLQYMLDDMIDDYEQEEVFDFFKESENFSLEEAREAFAEDEYSDEELRISRIQFISKVGN